MRKGWIALLIAAAVFGGVYGYTYMTDHRSAASLSAYCNIDFRGVRSADGTVREATLSMRDFRYSPAEPGQTVTVIADGREFVLDADVSQQPRAWDTSMKCTNEFFLTLPQETLAAILGAAEVRVRFTYVNGDVIDLPLDAHDLQYWKDQLH